MRIETPRLVISSVRPGCDADEFLAIFNSNPDYLEASDGKRTYERSDVEIYLYAETNREDGRCLQIRLGQGNTLVGTAALLVPHTDGYPWIGLLIIDADYQKDGLGREAARALETALAEEGWKEVRLGVLKRNERALPFWKNCGYGVVEERDSSTGPCWVMAKTLGPVS